MDLYAAADAGTDTATATDAASRCVYTLNL